MKGKLAICTLQGAVLSLCLSADASMLASCGKDSTVFFFRVKDGTALEPVCFAKVSDEAAECL